MESEPTPEGHPFCLPPGTRVQDWLLMGCHGHGAHGVVYRAFRIGQERAGPVALKMAIFPWDPRFMREVGLLSLVHHPSIPRLLSLGFWQDPAGMFFPFIIMEWVEGTPLYKWARKHAPTSGQVLQVLAQLAWALEATHACRAVHRDVKGDNVLVRQSDGRAVLTDFGAGNYQSAARVTEQPMPPGTPEYQSPQARLFERCSIHDQDARYQSSPADDVYALGVTAYQLVTGKYPLGPKLRKDTEGTWHLRESLPPPPHELDPRVDPQLGALILRMLSLSPEARGTAGELAEALETAAAGAERSAGSSLKGPQLPAKRLRLREQLAAWTPVSAGVLAGVVLALWVWQSVHLPVASAPAPADENTNGLGESGAKAPLPPAKEPSQRKAVAQDEPPKPFPGQLSPDAKGRCPGRRQLPINGGCWVEYPAKDAKECEEDGYVFFKARCYSPAMDTRRKPPPTSAPSDFR